jgi:hypothetical protein
LNAFLRPAEKSKAVLILDQNFLGFLLAQLALLGNSIDDDLLNFILNFRNRLKLWRQLANDLVSAITDPFFLRSQRSLVYCQSVIYLGGIQRVENFF